MFYEIIYMCRSWKGNTCRASPTRSCAATECLWAGNIKNKKFKFLGCKYIFFLNGRLAEIRLRLPSVTSATKLFFIYENKISAILLLNKKNWVKLGFYSTKTILYSTIFIFKNIFFTLLCFRGNFGHHGLEEEAAAVNTTASMIWTNISIIFIF